MIVLSRSNPSKPTAPPTRATLQRASSGKQPFSTAGLLKGECSQDRDTVVKKLRGILDLLEHDDALDRGCVRRALTEGDGDVA